MTVREKAEARSHEIKDAFVAKIIETMQTRDITQAVVAGILGVSRQAVQLVLTHRNMKLETLLQITEALELDVEFKIKERESSCEKQS